MFVKYLNLTFTCKPNYILDNCIISEYAVLSDNIMLSNAGNPLVKAVFERKVAIFNHLISLMLLHLICLLGSRIVNTAVMEMVLCGNKDRICVSQSAN